VVLTNAEKQARWRAKRAAERKARPEVIEGELIAAAGSSKDLSEEERRELADRLADAAMGHLRRSQQLAALARLLRFP